MTVLLQRCSHQGMELWCCRSHGAGTLQPAYRVQDADATIVCFMAESPVHACSCKVRQPARGSLLQPNPHQ